ncbi:MAG: motility protein A [Synergistaceae bacterium]|nr:motility protein A [Synergistaceae bacterium]
MASGGNIGAYFDVPSLMITIGGAIGATIISNPGARLKTIGGCLKNVFFNQQIDLVGMVQMIVSFAEKARREGLLALEADIAEVDSDFMRKAMQLVVDGTDPELVRAILDTEIGNFEDRHSANKAVFDHLTEFAPSFGMIGTLIGLIAMLGNLQDVSALGPGMAVALITTMYGSMMANMFGSPVSKKLAAKSAAEVKSMELMVEGILAIQAGENPRIVEEKLKVYLPPAMREAFNQEEG